MSSDAPRSVKIARRLVGTLTLVPLSTLLIWIYAHEIKPYEVVTTRTRHRTIRRSFKSIFTATSTAPTRRSSVLIATLTIWSM